MIKDNFDKLELVLKLVRCANFQKVYYKIRQNYKRDGLRRPPQKGKYKSRLINSFNNSHLVG